MREFKVNEKVIVETSDGGKFEGTVAQSTSSSVRLRNVVGDGKDVYKELNFFSYEVVSISSTKEPGDKHDRVVEGSSSGDEVDQHLPIAVEKVDASDGLVTSCVAKDNESDAIKKEYAMTETPRVNRRGKAPVAILKSVPPHLKVFSYPSRGTEELMLTAVAREELGEGVDLDMNLLSGNELQLFLEEIDYRDSENSVPVNFVMLSELSSPDAIACFRHINTCKTVGISWEGVQSETVRKRSSVSLLCFTTSYLVCVLDMVAITGSTGGIMPEFLCDFIRNRSEDRTFVTFDVRPLAHALLSNYDVELSAQTVDLQLFELSLSALNTGIGRRPDGSSLLQSFSIYKLVLDEFNVERNPLYVRGKYRESDMTLWMKRPLSNVLLNAALFHGCYLVPLFHRLCQKMLRPVVKNSHKRWNLAMSNNCISSWDLNNSFVSASNPLSFWRVTSPVATSTLQTRRSLEEKSNQAGIGKTSKEEKSNTTAPRRSLSNTFANPPDASASMGPGICLKDDDEQNTDATLNDKLEMELPAIRSLATPEYKAKECKMKSVPCTSILFDRSQFFDTDIAVDSSNTCTAAAACDGDFGTIPSKTRHYPDILAPPCASFKTKENPADFTSRICTDYVMSKDAIEVTSDSSPSPSPPSPLLHDIPVKSFGRGRGLKNMLISRPGSDCF